MWWLKDEDSKHTLLYKINSISEVYGKHGIESFLVNFRIILHESITFDIELILYLMPVASYWSDSKNYNYFKPIGWIETFLTCVLEHWFKILPYLNCNLQSLHISVSISVTLERLWGPSAVLAIFLFFFYLRSDFDWICFIRCTIKFQDTFDPVNFLNFWR